MKQIYHPYHLWEDWINGMWRKETKEYEETELQNIIQFTGNHHLYGAAMFEVIESWIYTMEHNLTNTSINKKAFIGHCACCFKHGYPEYLVRQGWWKLTENQRNLADKQAIKAFKIWHQKKKLLIISQLGNKDVIQMEFQMKYQ